MFGGPRKNQLTPSGMVGELTSQRSPDTFPPLNRPPEIVYVLDIVTRQHELHTTTHSRVENIVNIAEQLGEVQVGLEHTCIVCLVRRRWLQRTEIIKNLTAMSSNTRENDMASRPERSPDTSR